MEKHRKDQEKTTVFPKGAESSEIEAKEMMPTDPVKEEEFEKAEFFLKEKDEDKNKKKK